MYSTERKCVMNVMMYVNKTETTHAGYGVLLIDNLTLTKCIIPILYHFYLQLL